MPPKIQFLQQIRNRLLYRSLKSLYGLKQSGKLWNQNIITFFKSIGFTQLNGNPNILIQKSEEETSLVSMYVNDFLLVLKIIALLEELKECFIKKYDTKDLKEVKTIIRWQISCDIALSTMKINQSAFIRDLIIEEDLIEYNANIILIKAGSTIDMGESKNYEKTDLREYQ